MASSTRSRVCARTLGWSLSTRDTVWCDTPASRATSIITAVRGAALRRVIRLVLTLTCQVSRILLSRQRIPWRMRILTSVGIPAATVLGVLILVQIVHWIVLRLGRRSPVFTDLARRAHRPVQVGLALIALYYAVRDTNPPAPWRTAVLHLIQLLVIAAIAWFVGALLIVAEDWALNRWRTDVEDNRKARRLHTQVVMIRRVT